MRLFITDLPNNISVLGEVMFLCNLWKTSGNLPHGEKYFLATIIGDI